MIVIIVRHKYALSLNIANNKKERIRNIIIHLTQ